MNTCCNSDFGLSNGTNMIEHIAQYYGQIRTVNSPVTASNPTWMVCSKSEGEEISGLSLSRSFFLPPAGKGQGSKCGSSTVMHVRFFFTVYVSMYVSILHISHLSQRQTWRWSCLWTSSPPVQTAAAESCDWLTVSPWVLLLGCSSWQGGRGACPHTLRCHTSTHTCTCAHEKIHTQITMHTRNTASLLNVESLVHFFLFFLLFFLHFTILAKALHVSQKCHWKSAWNQAYITQKEKQLKKYSQGPNQSIHATSCGSALS